MAIDWTQTNHVWSTEHPILAAQVSTLTEGMALVQSVSGALSTTFVQASAGSTTQPFFGIALAPRRIATNTTMVAVTAPVGGGTVLLPNTVLSASTIGAYNTATGALVAISTSAASGSNIQSSTDATTGLTALTFDATDAGNSGGTFYVTYTYTMSNFEMIARYGNTSPGLYATDVLSQTGVFRIGRIAVNNFANNANWWGAADGRVKVIAGGVFTDSASGTGYVPTNVDVVSYPTTAYPWLVLEIH